MGNEYRDALSAAQRRIDTLEKELELARAGIPAPPSGQGWVGGLIAASVLTVLLVGVFVGLVRARRAVEAPEPVPVAAVAPAVVTHYGVSFYTGGTSRPHLVDVDGDGKKEIVSLFWSSAEDTPLHVGVLDRETFAVRWMRGPFPSQWSGQHTHMELVGRRAIVTDSREKLHVFDLGSGEEVHTADIAGGARDVCKLPGTDAVALARANGGFRVLSLADFSMRDATKADHPQCTTRYTSCDEKDKTSAEPCSLWAPNAQKRAKNAAFRSSGTAQAVADTMLVEGKLGAQGEASDAAFLALDRKTLAYKWEAKVIVEGDLLHLGGQPQSVLTPQAVVTLYQTRRGVFRLVARAMADGKESWSIVVPQAKEGTYAGDFYAEDGEVFLFVDHALHVFDVATGKERRAATWF